eukprot:3567200-Prymnesium_polylepis.1
MKCEPVSVMLAVLALLAVSGLLAVSAECPIRNLGTGRRFLLPPEDEFNGCMGGGKARGVGHQRLRGERTLATGKSSSSDGSVPRLSATASEACLVVERPGREVSGAAPSKRMLHLLAEEHRFSPFLSSSALSSVRRGSIVDRRIF